MKFLLLTTKQLIRHPVRTLLTASGVAVAMFLFCAVEAMRRGVERATEMTANDTTLVVYRENRFCPFTSRLPQYYQDRIEAIAGVERVIPMRIQVSNCRASLDVVTFRGVPEGDFSDTYLPDLEIIEGASEDWRRRSDAALIGESLANRRALKPGDRLSAAGITVSVAGVFRSDQPQDQNVAYTHLSFIQEASRKGGTGGVVTQFNVKVASSDELARVAKAIDDEFERESDPTATRPEKAFVAQAAADVIELVGFASWLGWGALVAIFALVANAIILAVHDRVKEHAILQTLGYKPRHVIALILMEAMLLGLAGGLCGAAVALLVIDRGYAVTIEGLNLEVTGDPVLLLLGFLLSIGLGLLAGLVPAFRAARNEIAASFRAV